MQLLAREGNNAGAAVQLKALAQAVERQEPRNPALWQHLAQPYARLAGQPSATCTGVTQASGVHASRASDMQVGYQTCK